MHAVREEGERSVAHGMAARGARVDVFDDVVSVPRLRPQIDEDWDLPGAEASNPLPRAVDIDVELTVEATQNGNDASLDSPCLHGEPADSDGDGSWNGSGRLRGLSSKKKSYARLAEEGILPSCEPCEADSHTSAGPGAAVEEAEPEPESKDIAMDEDTSIIVPPDSPAPLTARALCLIALMSLVLTVVILLLTGATAPEGILAAGTSTVRALLNGDGGAWDSAADSAASLPR